MRRVWRRMDRSSEEVHRIRRSLGALADDVGSTRPDTVCIALEAWTAAVCLDLGRRTICRVAGLGSITDEWVRNGFIEAGSRHVPWLRDRERFALAGAERVVVLWRAGGESVADLGASPRRTSVIANGISLGPVPERQHDPECVRVLSVSNLRHAKGMDLLAQAVVELDLGVRQRVRLVHVGEGNATGNASFEAARDMLRAAGVDYAFRGAVSRPSVAAEFARANLFVLPSRRESFGNALLEAMGAGLPAIGTDVGAVPEILGESAAAEGLVVPPGDVAALGRALTHLIGDPKLCRRLGLANRARIETEYTLERMIARYSALVHEVAR